jgi:hypothetical protein
VQAGLGKRDRASGIVQAGSCKRDRASGIVQAGSCKRDRASGTLHEDLSVRGRTARREPSIEQHGQSIFARAREGARPGDDRGGKLTP